MRHHGEDKMTIEQAMAVCTWDLLDDSEKAIVEHYKAHRDDPAAKEQFLEVWRKGMERRVALVA